MSQQINLANPQLTQKRYAFGLREMAIGVGVAALAALGWGLVVNDRARTLEAQAIEQEAKLADARQALAAQQAAAARPASALLTERVESTRVQVARRETLLATLGDTLGADTVGFAPRLRALSASHVEGVWLNGFELAPDAVVLRGSALQAGLVTTYLDRLGRQAAFAGLRFTGVQAGQPQSRPVVEGAAPAATATAQVDFELVAGQPERTEADDAR